MERGRPKAQARLSNEGGCGAGCRRVPREEDTWGSSSAPRGSYLALPAVDLEALKAEFQDDSPASGTVLGGREVVGSIVTARAGPAWPLTPGLVSPPPVAAKGQSTRRGAPGGWHSVHGSWQTNPAARDDRPPYLPPVGPRSPLSGGREPQGMRNVVPGARVWSQGHPPPRMALAPPFPGPYLLRLSEWGAGVDLRGSGVIPSPTLQGSEPSGEVPPIPAPYLQCPQLLLDQPHTLLGVQVVHGEGAHILLGGRGGGWGNRGVRPLAPIPALHVTLLTHTLRCGGGWWVAEGIPGGQAPPPGPAPPHLTAPLGGPPHLPGQTW